MCVNKVINETKKYIQVFYTVNHSSRVRIAIAISIKTFFRWFILTYKFHCCYTSSFATIRGSFLYQEYRTSIAQISWLFTLWSVFLLRETLYSHTELSILPPALLFQRWQTVGRETWWTTGYVAYILHAYTIKLLLGDLCICP